MEIIQKAEKLLESCSEILLSSVSEQGYPRICVLSKIRSEGIKKIYVATGHSGTKVRHFKQNNKASVCFYSGFDSVTLTGTVTILTDRETKKQMWLDWFINHFPGGIDDPEYCVIEFTSEEATLCIDGEFVTLEV